MLLASLEKKLCPISQCVSRPTGAGRTREVLHSTQRLVFCAVPARAARHNLEIVPAAVRPPERRPAERALRALAPDSTEEASSRTTAACHVALPRARGRRG